MILPLILKMYFLNLVFRQKRKIGVISTKLTDDVLGFIYSVYWNINY